MHTHPLQWKVKEAERKHFFFIYKARLAALLMVPSHTYLFTWPRAAGCKLCFRATERGMFRSVSTGRQWPELAKGPTVSLQIGQKATYALQQGPRDIPASPSHQLPLKVHFAAGTTPHSHGRPALLYRIWVLKVLKHFKQKVLFLPIFQRNFHRSVHPTSIHMINLVTVKTKTKCLISHATAQVYYLH